jgi:hypothetical protein
VPELDPIYQHRFEHDPSNLNEARRLAESDDKIRLGVFYKNPDAPRYEELRRLPKHTAEERIKLLNEEFDRYAV